MFPNKASDDQIDSSAQQENQDGPTPQDVQSFHDGDELSGKLSSNPDQERLPRSVMEMDTQSIQDGMLVDEAFNQNLSSFMPDMMFKELVTNYKNAKKLYGDTIIRELGGYDPRFVEKNISIPEFQRELKKRLKDSAQNLQERGVIKKGGVFTPEALNTAALFLIDEEYKETFATRSSLGEQSTLQTDIFGEKSFTRPYKSQDHYKDIALRQTVHTALRRGHKILEKNDLQSFERESKQKLNIIYALDISGSMKGEKLRLAKKAGVSLAHRAIRDSNQVGLVLFESEVANTVHLTKDLLTFTKPLAVVSPGKETDIALAIEKSTELLHDAQGIKHIVILTDGLHTTSDEPQRIVGEKVLAASAQHISISVVGINLDPKGLELAQDIVDKSGGKLHGVKEAKDLGGVILADYTALQ
ncbi:MAG: vWA domain-containing protein [Candidatus Nanoarchaeia archaeon]